MKVSTHTTQMGETAVRMCFGIREHVVYFRTRQDALALLKALRKRAR